MWPLPHPLPCLYVVIPAERPGSPRPVPGTYTRPQLSKEVVEWEPGDGRPMPDSCTGDNASWRALLAVVSSAPSTSPGRDVVARGSGTRAGGVGVHADEKVAGEGESKEESPTYHLEQLLMSLRLGNVSSLSP
jgi:hypothetical protein